MSTDTAEIDLSYVEAERLRQLSERSGRAETEPELDRIDLETLDPASRAEAIVAEVLASAKSVDDLIADLHIDLDHSPEGDEAGATEDEPAARREPIALPVDHPSRAHVVLLDRDPALVLLPGQAIEVDGTAYVPDGEVSRHRYGPLVERALAPLHGNVRLLTAHLPGDVEGRRDLTRWILVAAVWAAAMGMMVPLALGMAGSAVDMQIDLFPQQAPADTLPGAVVED